MLATSTFSSINAQLSILGTSIQNVALAVKYQSFWNSQLFAAIVGAAIGALVPLSVALYKDRARIKVRTHTSFISRPNAGLRTGFSATIYNFGRRPITVKSFYLKFADGDSLVFPTEPLFVGGSSGLPKTLGEGNSHMVTILAGTIAMDIRRKGNYPVAVCYEDALANVYKRKTSKKFWESMFASENKSVPSEEF